MAAFGAPAVGTVNPLTYHGDASVAKTLEFTSGFSGGAGTISQVEIVISSTVSTEGGCSIVYYPDANAIYLMNDGGTTWVTNGPAYLGSASTTYNSQCSIDGLASSHTFSSGTLHLYVNVTFNAAWFGNSLSYYEQAIDTSSVSSGWQQLTGAWFHVTRPRRGNLAPDLGTLSNTTGVVESTQTVVFTASDPNGASDLTQIDFQMNTPANLAMNGGQNACFGVWLKSFASVFIFDDAALYWYQVALGSGDSYSNTQCTVYGVGSSFTPSRNTGTLSLQIQFTGALTGTLDMYEKVFDLSGASDLEGWGDISTTSGNNITVNGAAVNADAPDWTQIMLSTGPAEVNYFKYIADPSNKIEIAQSAVPIGGSSSSTDLDNSPRPPYTYNFSAIAASPGENEYNINIGRNVCALGANQDTTFGDYSISPDAGRAQTDAAEFNDSHIESGVRGFEFLGSFNGGLVGSEQTGVSAIDVVYLHDQACSVGGHEYGLAKIVNVSGPDSGGGHLLFYYADHANCVDGNCNASDSVTDTRSDEVDLVNLQANSASTYEYYFKVYLVPSANAAFAPWGYFFRIQVVDPWTSALAKCTVNGSTGDCEVDVKMQSWFRADLMNGLSARVQSGILASHNPDNAGGSPGLYVDMVAVGQ
jgi:hypothetical protein